MLRVKIPTSQNYILIGILQIPILGWATKKDSPCFDHCTFGFFSCSKIGRCDIYVLLGSKGAVDPKLAPQTHKILSIFVYWLKIPRLSGCRPLRSGRRFAGFGRLGDFEIGTGKFRKIGDSQSLVNSIHGN